MRILQTIAVLSGIIFLGAVVAYYAGWKADTAYVVLSVSSLITAIATGIYFFWQGQIHFQKEDEEIARKRKEYEAKMKK